MGKRSSLDEPKLAPPKVIACECDDIYRRVILVSEDGARTYRTAATEEQYQELKAPWKHLCQSD